jgi:hypothetical protein
VANKSAHAVDEVTQLGTGIPAPAVNGGERSVQLGNQAILLGAGKRRSVDAINQVLSAPSP